MVKFDDIVPVRFTEGRMLILDQTKLPGEEVYIEMETKEDVWDAIYELKVRGAPAIGVAAGYGLYVAARNIAAAMKVTSQAGAAAGNAGSKDGSRADGADTDGGRTRFLEELEKAADYLESARPTAVNLSWAIKRVMAVVKAMPQETTAEGYCERMLEEAEAIRKEDEASCYAMGEYGLSLLKPGMGILTHCNAGTIATAKYGTCLAPLYLGHEQGYDFHVFADETRPLLQGARLTSWELHRAGIDVTLICDNMASIVMKNGWIDAVVVGCDRMAANGDGANKIGTSGVAILAKEYGIPFYMFVPTSTIDLNTATGDDIVIEQRKGEEIYQMWYEKDMAPAGVKTYNPAFDVTNHEYITAVTEKGVVRPPYDVNLRKLFEE